MWRLAMANTLNPNKIWNNFFTKQRKTQPTIVVIFGLPVKLLKNLK